LNTTRTAKKVVCQCPVGAGSKCKHITALITYANSEGTSKSDKPQQWINPLKYGEMYIKKQKNIKSLSPKII